MSEAPGVPLVGDALGWYELLVTGALRLPPAYPALVDAGADPLPEPALSVPPLVVPADLATAALTAGRLDLRDPEGAALGTVAVESIGPADDPGTSWVAGPLVGATAPRHLDHLDLRRTPEQVRALIAEPRTALWTDWPVSRTLREAAVRTARERGGALLTLLCLAADDETHTAAHRAVRLARAVTTSGPGDATVLVAAPRLGWTADDVLLRAAVAGGYGADVLLVPAARLAALGEGAAGAVSAAAALGVAVRAVSGEPDLDPGAVDELLDAGSALPDWYAEPPVAELLARSHRPRHRAGFTVLLSGLSGSGKSTVARGLVARLLEHDERPVLLLDGDEVRLHLSQGLGFGRADRDTNVRRIGYVAAQVTKAGGIAVCCPIAPYDATRRDVRAMVEQYGAFVLGHVATPLEECERRDRKGLYAKARRGEIPEFTGISDPYETPTDAEVVVDTTGRTLADAVAVVEDGLRRLGLLRW